MTYFCSTCVVNWYPYQATDGRCPECRGGTRRTLEPVSDDAVERHRAATVKRTDDEISYRKHREFDLYYAQREAARLNAAQDTDEIDTAAVQRAIDAERSGA